MKIFLVAIAALTLVPQMFLFAQSPTGSMPWRLENRSPEDVALEVVRALKEDDYFRIYGLISNSLLSEVKSSMSKMDTSAFGVKVDVFSVMSSDFGRRYGTLALFDQIMAAGKKSKFEAIDEFAGKKITIGRVDSKQATKILELTANGTDHHLRIYLSEHEGKWYLDGFALNSEVFLIIKD